MSINLKNVFACFCALLISCTLSSQTLVIDSLKSELDTHIEKDTTRVNLLNAIAYKHQGRSQDQLKRYANEANTLAKEIGFIKGEARSLYIKGIYYIGKSDLEKAKIEANYALGLYQKIDNTVEIASCYSLIGYIFYVQGELERAEELLKKSITIFDSLDEKKKILAPYNNLALVYTAQGKKTEALAYFQICLRGNREQGNKNNTAGALLNIARVYSYIDQNDKALPFLLESLELSKEIENDLFISNSLIGLGYVYRFKKEYNKALNYYNEGLLLSTQLDSKEGLYNCYSNIGGLYLERKEFDLALTYYKKSLEASQALGSKTGICGSYIELGVIYYNKGNKQKALENLLKAKKIADEISLIITQKEANLYLAKIYEESGDYKAALERFKEYKILNDSLFNKEQIEKITELEYEYKYRQELENASDREQILTKTVKSTSEDLAISQRNSLIAIIAILLLLIISGSIIFFLKLKQVQAKNKNIFFHQKLLRSQMTPHFIFNSLSILQGLILNKEEKKSITYLSKFSKLLRITLENSRHKTVSLSSELEAINNYMSLQNLDMNPPYIFELSLDENMEDQEIFIPPMLIQPFIENVIEHAFVSQKENKQIAVDLTFENNKLVCTIIDNGIGINSGSKKHKESKKSLATTITSERLIVLSNEFQVPGSIKVENRKKYGQQGTIVTLVIPYKLNPST